MGVRCKKIVIWVLCMFFGIVNAPKSFAYYDDENAAPHQREISKDEWNKIVKSRNYYYKDQRELSEKDLEKARSHGGESGNFDEQINEIPQEYNLGSSSQLDVRTISIIIIILIVGVLVFFFIVRKGAFFKKKSAKVQEYLKDELSETFYKEDLRTLFEKALNEGNDLEAVRLSYIWVLQLLDKKRVIVFDEKKTNSDYRLELYNSQFLTSFKEIARVFEFVVYGEYKLTRLELDNYVKLIYETRDRLS